MKTLITVLMLVFLAACSRQPVQPTGIYRLGTTEKMLVLDVRASGDYVLQIDGPDRMTDEIRGRWQDQRTTHIDARFEGIVWHGSEPERGHGSWPVRFEGDGGICLDAEGLLCFTKDDPA
jgi:hypothetical protein